MGLKRWFCLAALYVLAAIPPCAQERPRILSGTYVDRVHKEACGRSSCLAETLAASYIHAFELDGARMDALYLRPTGFGLAGFYELPKTHWQRTRCLIFPCCTHEAHLSVLITEGPAASDNELLEIIATETPNLKWPRSTTSKMISPATRFFAIGFIVREVCEARKNNKRVDMTPAETRVFFRSAFRAVSALVVDEQ